MGGFIDAAPSFVSALLSLNCALLFIVNVLSSPISDELHLYVFRLSWTVSAGFMGSASDWVFFSGLGYYCSGEGVSDQSEFTRRIFNSDDNDTSSDSGSSSDSESLCGDIFWPNGLISTLGSLQDIQDKIASVSALYASLHIIPLVLLLIALGLTLAKASPSVSRKFPKLLPADKFGNFMVFLVTFSTLLLFVAMIFCYAAVSFVGDEIGEGLSIERGPTAHVFLGATAIGVIASTLVMMHDRGKKPKKGGLPR